MFVKDAQAGWHEHKSYRKRDISLIQNLLTKNRGEIMAQKFEFYRKLFENYILIFI